MSDAATSGAGSEGTQSAPQPTEKFDRLKGILRTMFQLDRGDLDFGLYRIMNLKSAEVGTFLDNDLLPQVKEKLQLTSAEERASLEKELEDARETARGLGVDPDSNPPPKIVELNRRLAERLSETALAEEEIRTGHAILRNARPRAGSALCRDSHQRGAACRMGEAVCD